MGMEEVIAEIDRRIARLEAEAELLEARLERERSEKSIKVESFSIYYLAFTAFWVFAGLFLLAYLKRKVVFASSIPLGLYALIAVATVGVPLAYILLGRSGEEDRLPERVRALKTTVSAFYKPMKRALEEGDREALVGLAERLLNDPYLARAVELANEGDPKLNAYALYLYALYSEDLRGEVEEALGRLTNRPLRKLLEGLIGE